MKISLFLFWSIVLPRPELLIHKQDVLTSSHLCVLDDFNTETL
jgi:hypothetical protein